MSNERGLDPRTAYTFERRIADMRKHIEWAARHNRLSSLRPGYIAGTYGGGLISKEDVKAEIAKHTELGGFGK